MATGAPASPQISVNPNPSGTVLWICTDEIRSSFILNEVKHHATRFREVVLVSKSPLDLAELKDFPVRNVVCAGKAASIYSLPALLTFCLQDLFSVYSSMAYLKRWRYLLAYLRQANARAGELAQAIKNSPSSHVFLSYWFADWALVLSLLKKKKQITEFFSRAHGRDLFEYREPVTGKLPFRRLQLSQCSGVFSVSDAGTRYLKDRYPDFASKISTLYLGTADHGTNPFHHDQLFTVATCARIRDVKRIHLVPEILKKLGFPVKWIHIGDENLNATNDPTIPVYIRNKESLKDFKNIETEFTGSISNDAIYDIYREKPVNLFLNLSTAEGLPVVLMEAISMGIPVLATDVGGCREVVTDETGWLIPADFEVQDAAEFISEFRQSPMNDFSFRESTRRYWQQHFVAKDNYEKLIRAIC